MPLIIATPSTIAIAVSAARSLRPSRPLSATPITPPSARSSPSSTSAAVASLQLLDDQPVGEEEDRGRRSRRRAASCVTITVVWPYASTESRSRSRISPPVFESRLPVGSSAKRIVGRVTSARAIATRCCWPPESSDGRCVRRSARPGLLEQLLEPAPVGLLAGDRERQDDVLLGRQHRQQVEELEDEADVLAAEPRQLRVGERRDLRRPRSSRVPARRLVEAGEDVHQRRLARSPRGP